MERKRRGEFQYSIAFLKIVLLLRFNLTFSLLLLRRMANRRGRRRGARVKAHENVQEVVVQEAKLRVGLYPYVLVLIHFVVLVLLIPFFC